MIELRSNLFLSTCIDMTEFEKCLSLCNHVFISAPTGAGKTTFLINQFVVKVATDGLKGLYLVPRTILLNQIKEDIRVAETQRPDLSEMINKNLDVMTYHQIAKLYQMGSIIPYDYVICDEAHTMLTESTFATESFQESYDFVQSLVDAKKIYVSATMESFRKFVIHDKNLKEVDK